jgi:hypothetical protein
MATAGDRVHTEPFATPQQVPERPVLILRRPGRKWAKWALLIGVAIALAVGAELWRMHVANAIGYDTVPVERGTVQASVTASGTLNAVVGGTLGWLVGVRVCRFISPNLPLRLEPVLSRLTIATAAPLVSSYARLAIYQLRRWCCLNNVLGAGDCISRTVGAMRSGILRGAEARRPYSDESLD